MTNQLLRSALGLAVVLGLAASASAQVIVTRYAPGAVYVPAPAPVTTYYAPAAGPVTTYYAPPVTAYYPPITSYYAPPVNNPVPFNTYYAPGAPVVTTGYAPVFAGAPAVVYRPNPVLFPRRRVVVAPYGVPYYTPIIP